MTVDTLAPVVDWSTFHDSFDWQQGEHVSLIGPTGQGKTTLALKILPRRSHTCILATKPVDPTLSKLASRRTPPSERYVKQRTWAPTMLTPRVLLWPPIDNLREDIDEQVRVFNEALPEIYSAGGWCVYADELQYLVRVLGLGGLLEMFWYQGRSLKVSLVASFQRPAWVPVAAYSSSTHLFFWRTNDDRDLKTIGGLGTLDSKQIREIVKKLSRYEVLYINTRDDTMLVTKVEQ